MSSVGLQRQPGLKRSHYQTPYPDYGIQPCRRPLTINLLRSDYIYIYKREQRLPRGSSAKKTLDTKGQANQETIQSALPRIICRSTTKRPRKTLTRKDNKSSQKERKITVSQCAKPTRFPISNKRHSKMGVFGIFAHHKLPPAQNIYT